MDRIVDLVNGVATLRDKTEIKLGGGGAGTVNSVTFKVGRGFGSTAKVSKLTLYQWNPSEPHQGTEVGAWDRDSSSTEPFTYLNVGENSTADKNIDVSDTNTGDDEFDYCFTVTVNDGSDHTTADPELRVLKKKL